MSMRAVMYEKGKSPTGLVLKEILRPYPADGEVLVKVHAVSVNAADYRSMRMGIVPKGNIYGSDVAGIVAAVGDQVSKFKVGDEVFGDLANFGFGGFAEYVAAPESALALKPAGVSFEDAAAVPMAAVTALQGLRDKGRIQAGQQVLICGAGGGVGTFAVQLAKHFGAQVTAVCGPRNAARVQALGADRVIDYTVEDFTKRDEHYDLILAVNGNYSLSAYRKALKSHGILVMAGGALSQLFKTIVFGRVLSLGSKKFRVLSARPNPKDLEFVIRLVEQGKLTPVIDRRYPLQETPEAVQYLGKGHAGGKVIIEVV